MAPLGSSVPLPLEGLVNEQQVSRQFACPPFPFLFQALPTLEPQCQHLTWGGGLRPTC